MKYEWDKVSGIYGTLPKIEKVNETIIHDRKKMANWDS